MAISDFDGRKNFCEEVGLPRLTFASCYVYSPTGCDAASERSRMLSELLKADDTRFILKYASRVRQQASVPSPLHGFFRPSSVLVPIPGCAVTQRFRPCVSEHLAAALLAQGFGQRVWSGIHRIRAVRKSATAHRGSRPSVATHFDSFVIEPASGPIPQVVLVDDVVTKGRTLLAAAARLQQSLPYTEIRAFALVRTMGKLPGVSRLLEPCVGEIRWRWGDARREP